MRRERELTKDYEKWRRGSDVEVVIVPVGFLEPRSLQEVNMASSSNAPSKRHRSSGPVVVRITER